MKKIYIVSGYYYPEQTPRAYRTTELAEEYSRRGYAVEVYLPKKSGVLYSTGDDNITINYFSNNDVWNLLSGSSFVSKVINKVLNNVAFYINYPVIQYLWLIPHNIVLKDNINKIISIAQPHSIHWGIERLLAKQKEEKILWIADCGDPFMGNQVKRPPFYFKYLEKRFCSKCDFITVPTEAAINAYYEEFHSKIRVIPQGFSFKNIIIDNYAKNSIPTFAYAGIFYKGYRDPTRFFIYLSSLKFDFRFILYSPESRVICKYKRILGDKLIIKQPIPREKLIKELSKLDFLININNTGSFQTPSKLIDYKLSRRPILTIDNSKRNYADLLSFIKGDFSHDTQIDNLQDYNIENVVDKFEKLYK